MVAQELGWKKIGSLLIAKTSKELSMLRNRVELFSEAGVTTELLSIQELVSKEPLVDVGKEGGAAFLPNDCQIDALRAVEFIQKENRGFILRYAEFFNNPVIDVLRSSGNGEIEGVQIKENALYSKKAVVIVASSWSGSLMRKIAKKFNVNLDIYVKQRKEHLLVIENFNSVNLNHGLMEVGHMDHQIAVPTESGVVDYSGMILVSILVMVKSIFDL